MLEFLSAAEEVQFSNSLSQLLSLLEDFLVGRIGKLLLQQRSTAILYDLRDQMLDSLDQAIVRNYISAYGSEVKIPRVLVSRSRKEIIAAFDMAKRYIRTLPSGFVYTYPRVRNLNDIPQITRKAARKFFLDNLLNIRGRRFRLDYYIELVRHSAVSRAYNAGIIRKAQETTGLVQVSPNPSMFGDYCDEYRGKVFSLELSTTFPWLGATPNGGPPFHPWCRHYLLTFDPTDFSIDDLQTLADVDSELLLQTNERKHNRIVEVWNTKKNTVNK